jgi:hypothetical protein
MKKLIWVFILVFFFLPFCQKDDVKVHVINAGETYAPPDGSFRMCYDFTTFDPVYFGLLFSVAGDWRINFGDDVGTVKVSPGIDNSTLTLTSSQRFHFNADTVYSIGFYSLGIYQGRYCLEFDKL